jgi:Fur family peroxide stress response transcriptional regulator
MRQRNPKIRMDEMTANLRERGCRMTPQRLALLQLIAASEGHPGAMQLYSQVKEQFPTMSLASVYKTLNLLKALGQVQEIEMRDDSRYDGNRPEPHPHLICTQCRKIVDGQYTLEPGVIRKLETASGFQILRPQITLYGLCPDCRHKR